MNSSKRTSNLRAIGGFFSLLLCAGLASGQFRDQYQDRSRDDSGEIRQTVARISYISGSVSFARGDDPDNWQAADRNVPMSLGDRVYTNRDDSTVGAAEKCLPSSDAGGELTALMPVWLKIGW